MLGEKAEYLATVRNHAAGTKFYNINIKNSYGLLSLGFFIDHPF